MDNWDSLHIEQIRDYTAKTADAMTRIADAFERLIDRKEELQIAGKHADVTIIDDVTCAGTDCSWK